MTPFSIFNPHPPLRGKTKHSQSQTCVVHFIHPFRASFCLFVFFPDSSPPVIPVLHRPPLNTYTRSQTTTRAPQTRPPLLPLFWRSLPHSGLQCEEYDFRSLVSFGFFIFKASRTATQFHSLSRASHSKSRFITGFIFVYQEARCHQMCNSL